MKPASTEPSLYNKVAGDKLSVITGACIDDTLCTGAKPFNDSWNLTRKRFDYKPKPYYRIRFTDMEVDRTGKWFVILQHKHNINLQQLSGNATFDEF